VVLHDLLGPADDDGSFVNLGCDSSGFGHSNPIHIWSTEAHSHVRSLSKNNCSG
jgi:hypothetical protein